MDSALTLGDDVPEAQDTPDAPAAKAWPSVHSRRTASQEAVSAVDPADATAWSMPYTDLTMLLMVFFIVMLSVVGPDPSETSDHQNNPNGTQSPDQSALVMEALHDTNRTAVSPIDGGDGILLDGVGILPDGGAYRPAPPPEPPREDADSAAQDSRDAETGAADGATDDTSDQTTDARTRAAPGSLAEDDPEAPPDAAEERDDFAAAWARRVQALETEAAAFLDLSGLDETITLKRTETGIELRLPDHLLFSSGSAEVQTDGIDLLARVAPFLNETDGDVQISGHTDNVPIQTLRFPSNWELSAARAIAVVRLLRQLGISEIKMQAVGHGANRPIASNSHATGRATNRRVTIDVTPRPNTARATSP